jgi:hypothetical protein
MYVQFFLKDWLSFVKTWDAKILRFFYKKQALRQATTNIAHDQDGTETEPMVV